MPNVINGLDRLLNEKELQDSIQGNIGYLCHSASVDVNLDHGAIKLKQLFGDRLVKLFGPQHGFVCDVQDNMMETEDFVHPYFGLVIHSLYGEVRIPTDKMLEGLDTIIVDLQDVGTRVYTYISTLGLLMQACENKKITVVVLDRPNPVGGEIVEGAVLEKEWKSFVGHFDIPMRHAMTMGEVAQYAKKYQSPNCSLQVIPMKNWKRSMIWRDCQQEWVNPSPNLSTPESAISFCGTVLFEGTNVSEGRGTTRALEVLGHPKTAGFEFADHLNKVLSETDLTGYKLRPLNFMPTFQKHAGSSCGGIHIHTTDASTFYSWRLGQMILKEFYHTLGSDFAWNDKPYEYEFKGLAIDFINGNTSLREWIERNGSYEELLEIEKIGMQDYLDRRQEVLIYS